MLYQFIIILANRCVFIGTNLPKCVKTGIKTLRNGKRHHQLREIEQSNSHSAVEKCQFREPSPPSVLHQTTRPLCGKERSDRGLNGIFAVCLYAILDFLKNAKPTRRVIWAPLATRVWSKVYRTFSFDPAVRMNVGHHEYLSLKLVTSFVLVASFFFMFCLKIPVSVSRNTAGDVPDFYKCCSELWTSSRQHFSPLTYLPFAGMLTRRHFIPGTRLPPLMERLECVFCECASSRGSVCLYVLIPWSCITLRTAAQAVPCGRQHRCVLSPTKTPAEGWCWGGKKGERGCTGFATVLTQDLMISRPAPTPRHAFSQQWGKWQGDIIMWHSVWRGVSEGIPPPPTVLAL